MERKKSLDQIHVINTKLNCSVCVWLRVVDEAVVLCMWLFFFDKAL